MTVAPPSPGSTSVRLGKAFLRPASERDHFELMRPVVTVTNEGDRNVTEQHPQPIGPLAVYRRFRQGDVPPSVSPDGPPSTMMTYLHEGSEPIKLVLVWWPRLDAAQEESDEAL